MMRTHGSGPARGAEPPRVPPPPLAEAAVARARGPARLPRSRHPTADPGPGHAGGRRVPAGDGEVQHVDAHVEAAADLIEEFDFLPRWRVDDVMASLAAPQGSVGPHVDGYDVF